jgi:hypothetical protein
MHFVLYMTIATKGSEHFSRPATCPNFRYAAKFGLDGVLKAAGSKCALLLKMSTYVE